MNLQLNLLCRAADRAKRISVGALLQSGNLVNKVETEENEENSLGSRTNNGKNVLHKRPGSSLNVLNEDGRQWKVLICKKSTQ